MQCVMIKPMKMAPTKPTHRPPFLKAIGMERIPEPILPLIMWKSAPAELGTIHKLILRIEPYRKPNSTRSLDPF